MNNQVLFRILEGQNIEGKYYLKKLLGSGGFGGVYLADEVVKDRFIRELAVKMIIADNPDKQLDELIFSTTLKHPNLIDCYTCGECQLNNIDFLYLLMEKADYSLEDKLKKGKLSEENVKELLLDIVNGLDYLHSQNPVIVHRDLKPGNILRVRDKWKISDFGLVRSLKGTATQTTTIIGSMGYAPPEAYEGKISPAWDIWSLGVVIYESLTGKLPFESDSPLHLMRQVADLEPDVKELSTQWQELVKSCLEKDGKQRSTARIVLQSLSASVHEKQVIGEDKNTIYKEKKNNLFKCIPIKPNIGRSASVNSIALSANGNIIVSGSRDNTIKTWDSHSRKLLHILPSHSDWVDSVAISPDGHTIVSGSRDNTIKIWDTTIEVWNVQSGKLVRTLSGHSDWVSSIIISADSNIIVSGSGGMFHMDNSIKIWDLHSGKLLRTLSGHSQAVKSIGITTNNNIIVSGSSDKTIKIWDLHSGKLVRTLSGHSQGVKSVAISGDNKTIVSGSGDRTIKIWDLATGKLRDTLKSHSDWVKSVAISRDGKTIVSSSEDETIKIWDLHSGKLVHTLRMNALNNGFKWSWIAYQVLFSPDDTQIIAGCSDGTIKIWDIMDLVN